jgi:hypothetical protein
MSGLAILLCYLLVGFGCYICILVFFPPRDGPSQGTASPSEEESAASEPLPFSLSRYVLAAPGLLLMLVFAPPILVLFVWQRRNEKSNINDTKA